MAAIKGQEVEGVLRRLDPRVLVLLFYGSDAGLVSERARAAAEKAVDDPSDPFQLIRLDGDALAANPARLADEASTIGLFGAKRALWVKPSVRNLAPAVEALLQARVEDTLVVIEAGELGKSSPLRTLCERSPRALALPCYEDGEEALERLVDVTLKEAGLAIDRDARALLVASLGGDRLATRGELAKLALYAHGRTAVTLADVEAIVSDVSSSAIDQVLDAAFVGDGSGIDAGVRRLASEGTSPQAVLALALRHAITLLNARAEVEAGRSVSAVVESWRGIAYPRRAILQRQVNGWTPAALRSGVERLQTAVLESRRMADLAPPLAQRALMEVARQARARKAG